MIKKEGGSPGKFGRGYSGFLTNILTGLKHCLDSESGCGKLMKKNHPEAEELINRYLNQKNSAQ